MFGVNRLALTSFFGLAMVVTFSGMLVVFLGVLILPDEARWLAVPGVVLLLAGIVLAVLGQLAVMGKRARLLLSDDGWVATPLIGRSTRGDWRGVKGVSFGKDGALVLSKADGPEVALSTRHLAGTEEDFRSAVTTRLNNANGYKTLAEAEAELAEKEREDADDR